MSKSMARDKKTTTYLDFIVRDSKIFCERRLFGVGRALDGAMLRMVAVVLLRSDRGTLKLLQ